MHVNCRFIFLLYIFWLAFYIDELLVIIWYVITLGTGESRVLWWACLFVHLSLCLSVHEHISGTAGSIFTKSFCGCYPWPWLSPSLAALWYVMYFRFYEWRHVFTLWPETGNTKKACTQSGSIWGSTYLTPWCILKQTHHEVESVIYDVYDCLVCEVSSIVSSVS